MKVEQIFEFPVKGLKGKTIPCGTISNRGLNMDRRWMLVDDSNSFLSQRQIPSLTQLTPSFDDGLSIASLANNESIEIDLNDFLNEEEVEVWGQVVKAKRASEEVNEWLSNKVKQTVKLFFMDEESIRPIRSEKEGDIVSFADGYPLLLTGSASLDDLNEKLERQITIDRFRTNVHVSTALPYEEETWKRIKIGEVIFRVAKKCARCQVINIDQETGLVSKEPLKTLSTYRKEGNKVNFGVNLIPESFGIIHEDDTITVLD